MVTFYFNNNFNKIVSLKIIYLKSKNWKLTPNKN